MPTMLIFGLGYSAGRLARRLRAEGWSVRGTGRAGNLAFDDEAGVRAALAEASHVLSSIPPDGDGLDPMLARYEDALSSAAWLGYLSSSGVYGDTGGAWVDESAPIGGGRRKARADADRRWQALGARVFRLPGIYGPGRSPLDRVRAGDHRVDQPGQVFSRIHVDDIVGGVLAAFGAPAGVYNLADDLPASRNAVTEEACRLLGLPLPPVVSIDDPAISAAARAFYGENRRVANGKAWRVLGWRPMYPSYREGLRALSASRSPASARPAPPAASGVQR